MPDRGTGGRAAGPFLALLAAVLGLGAALLASAPRAAPPAGAARDVTSRADFAQAVRDAPLALVYVHAAWCAPCVELGPVVDALARSEPARLLVLRVDAVAAPELAGDLHATPLPILVHYAHGKEVKRTSGSRSPVYLRQWLGLGAAPAR